MDGKSLDFHEQLFLFANQQQALNNMLSRSKVYVDLSEESVVVLKERLPWFELVVDMILLLAEAFRAVEDVLRIPGLVATPLYLTTLIFGFCSLQHQTGLLKECVSDHPNPKGKQRRYSLLK